MRFSETYNFNNFVPVKWKTRRVEPFSILSRFLPICLLFLTYFLIFRSANGDACKTSISFVLKSKNTYEPC